MLGSRPAPHAIGTSDTDPDGPWARPHRRAADVNSAAATAAATAYPWRGGIERLPSS